MANRAPRTVALPVALGMFAVGLIAVISIFGLYAAGHHNLPWWLNAATVLMPFGFAVGVVSVVLRARSR